ncbi:MAG: DUF1643 domain-containing protein [Candidimonas sp.]|nr:MAG: DUF1643 domain-containing protein [Candidimonas sp.]TAM24804.1 MAG: DUF1643 domain-containing protein [Candidimonas sp.]
MTAIISTCGTYRYQLTRAPLRPHPERSTALFVMLNPSAADATLDDPTIRRCRKFADTWGCAGITVANLYALRATNPETLWTHPDPIGPDNDMYLSSLAREYDDVVFAWGANAKLERVAAVHSIFAALNRNIWCLGITKSGAPRHPLYVRGDQPLIKWKLP